MSRCPVALGIGAAQAARPDPGHQPVRDLDLGGPLCRARPRGRARFAFLMATPITAGAALFEVRRLAAGEAGSTVSIGPLLVGMVAAFVSG